MGISSVGLAAPEPLLNEESWYVATEHDDPPTDAENLDLDPTVIQESPVLQRWLEQVPNILTEIDRTPSFNTRLRIGYTSDRDSDDSGILIGVDDIFVGNTGLTVSGDYRTQIEGSNEQYGVDLRYYLLPLGHRLNIAPVVGYRSISPGHHDTDGANVGLRLMLVPSRRGAADISLSQTWVNPGSDRQEVSRFTLSAGYAITRHLRLASDLYIQTAGQQQNTEVGILLEWLL